MQKSKGKTKMRESGKILFLATSAILAALSILLGKYLAINLGDTIRLSFENLPILLAGLYFGPWVGSSVGVVADLVGCVLVGYSINPIITLGAALIGFLSGLVGSLSLKQKLIKILLAVSLSHLIGSVLIKTVGLSIYYQMPFWVTLGWRCITYLIISVLEISILFALSQSRSFTLQMKKMQFRKKNQLH